jgi:hypothetical protein
VEHGAHFLILYYPMKMPVMTFIYVFG